MASFAEELHLRLIYRRIAVLRAAAANLSQQQQANAVRNRVTAELIRRGWRVPEIAAALGKTYRQVRHWYDQGRTLDCNGLAPPAPSGQPACDRLTVAEVAERLRVDDSHDPALAQGRTHAGRPNLPSSARTMGDRTCRTGTTWCP